MHLLRLSPEAAEAVAIPPPGEGDLDAVWAALPVGFYTTLRTYGGQGLLRLDRHLARLGESARLAGLPGRFDERAVRGALRGLLPLPGGAEARVRLLLAAAEDSGAVYAGVERLRTLPAAAYDSGLRCAVSHLARANPRIKTTGFIPPASAERARLAPGIHEALMASPGGEILEGLSSNFAAWAGGVLRTAGEGVLEGITLGVALDAARELGIAVVPRAVRLDELDALDEAFLSSSTRGVVPVVEIDGRVLGDGTPGPRTRALMERFAERVAIEAAAP